MNQQYTDQVRSKITEVLLQNASFYRTSPQDEDLHFIESGEIAILAYEMIKFAANVFGAMIPVAVGARWMHQKYFGDETSHRSGDQVAVSKEGTPEPILAESELRERLEALRSNVRDESTRQDLLGDLQHILEYHGWPSGEAESDAQNILVALVDYERIDPS